MKYRLLILFLTIITSTFANVNHIDINKVTKDQSDLEWFKYVVENQTYFSHWTPNWNFDKSKVELDYNLREAYRIFNKLPSKNTEAFLLLGDIAHYLYNLDVTNYHDSALYNYTEAQKLSPQDFRTDWFLGLHYTMANLPAKGIPLLLHAQRKLPQNQPADFWEDYVWSMGVANMPSHSIYGMEQERKITGKAGAFETQLGSTIKKRINNSNKDSTYQKQVIWNVKEGEQNTFISRPLGIKLSIDSTWRVSVFDYTKHTAAFIFNPEAIKNKNGRSINYSVAILMKTANEKDKLNDYLNTFIEKFSDKKKIRFSEKYKDMVAYEIKEKNLYPDIGGGHLYMIGIERNMPEYPGLLLEDPTTLKGKNNEVTFYSFNNILNRFKGKIFYAIMLDSCGDIHEESLAVFKAFFENQLLIE